MSPSTLAPSSSSSHYLLPRNPYEHVILADCRDEDKVYSSQMAYWSSTPTRTPNDITVVKTPHGQTAVWAGMTTESLFTVSGVKFVAKLGPKVADGQYAGSGSNGYDEGGNFSCWQIYKKDSYVYGKATCSQVYDCDRRPMPAVLPTPLPTATNSTGDNASSSSTGGLSLGALIPIVVGAVVAFLIALIAGLLIWRALRRNRDEPDRFLDFASRCCCGLGGRKPAGLPAGTSLPPAPEVKDHPSTIYEVDGTRRAELQGCPILPQELGGKENPRVAWELESPISHMPLASVLGKERHTKQWSWFPGDDRPRPGDVERGKRGRAELG